MFKQEEIIFLHPAEWVIIPSQVDDVQSIFL